MAWVNEARDHWDGIAAAWAKWLPVIEQGGRAVTDRLLDQAALAEGERVLDLASGIGEPAASAARRVGPGGLVVATDVAPRMVALGRERARRLGLGNLTFQEMDAGTPDFPAHSFDVALCRWGLMFVADLGHTLGRIHDILAPRGRIAAAVWAEPARVPAISLASRILSERLELPPPGEDERTPFDLADVEAFKQVLAAAGFEELRSEAVSVVYEFPSAEDFVAFRREVSPSDRKLAHIPAAQREAAWQAVAEALGPYRTADGRIVMENVSLCVAGRRG